MASATLLARSAPRSEHDPDVEASIEAAPEMHPLTGTFADPSHEAAFAAQCFRVAFPLHVLLMGLIIAVQMVWAGWMVIRDPSTYEQTRFLWIGTFTILLLTLIGRVVLHRMHNLESSQRIGSFFWAATIVLCALADVSAAKSTPACDTALAYRPIKRLIMCLMVACVNGSHGMSFWLKSSLAIVLQIEGLIVATVCGRAEPAVGSTIGLVFGYIIAHLVELLLRRDYVDKKRLLAVKQRLEERNDHLHASNERLQSGWLSMKVGLHRTSIQGAHVLAKY